MLDPFAPLTTGLARCLTALILLPDGIRQRGSHATSAIACNSKRKASVNDGEKPPTIEILCRLPQFHFSCLAMSERREIGMDFDLREFQQYFCSRRSLGAVSLW
jgi:hypothetical protein